MNRLLMMTGVAGLAIAAAAMPTKNELKKVQGVVNEVMSADVQAMKAGRTGASQVAANAEKYAHEADTEAAKFLLLKGAFGLYMQGGSYTDALRVLDTLTREIKDIPDKVMAEIVIAKLKKVSKSEGTAVFEYYERIERRMRLTEERVKLEKALKASPTSKEAHRDLAFCLAGLGDWKGALAHFVAAGGKEAEAAKAEQAGKASAADLWWEAASQGEAGDVCREHSAVLYRMALANDKLSGLGRALAKKRIAEVSPQDVASADVSAARQSVRTAESVPAAKAERPASGADGNVSAPKGSYDWSIPANLTVQRMLDLDLGCEEKMTFFAIPPGTCEMKTAGKTTQCKITRPFWVAQCNVTLGQYRALGFECANKELEKLAEECKGDKSVAVFAPPVRHAQSLAFYRALNARFGRQLPSGMVFRPVTAGEASLFFASPHLKKVPRFWENSPNYLPNGRGYLVALHNKGRFLECKTEGDIMEMNFKKDAPFIPWSFGYYMGILRQTRNAASFWDSGWSFCLDRVSAPDVVDPFHPGDDIAKRLAIGETVVDPFWYCAEDAPDQYVVRASGLKWCVDDGNHRVATVLRVAVGYDYVGEWKRKNGK